MVLTRKLPVNLFWPYLAIKFTGLQDLQVILYIVI